MKGKMCPVCGEGRLVRKVIEEVFEYKGRTLVVPDYVVYECDTCGEAIVDNSSLRRAGKILRDFQRKVDGFLSGEEIRKIRKKLGLSQEEMAEILGGGKKAFARYESGEVCQSRAMDNLLRILERYPELIEIIKPPSRKVVSMKQYLERKKHPYTLRKKGELFNASAEIQSYGT